jgi:hypothetical protein
MSGVAPQGGGAPQSGGGAGGSAPSSGGNVHGSGNQQGSQAAAAAAAANAASGADSNGASSSSVILSGMMQAATDAASAASDEGGSGTPDASSSDKTGSNAPINRGGGGDQGQGQGGSGRGDQSQEEPTAISSTLTGGEKSVKTTSATASPTVSLSAAPAQGSSTGESTAISSSLTGEAKSVNTTSATASPTVSLNAAPAQGSSTGESTAISSSLTGEAKSVNTTSATASPTVSLNAAPAKESSPEATAEVNTSSTNISGNLSSAAETKGPPTGAYSEDIMTVNTMSAAATSQSDSSSGVEVGINQIGASPAGMSFEFYNSTILALTEAQQATLEMQSQASELALTGAQSAADETIKSGDAAAKGLELQAVASYGTAAASFAQAGIGTISTGYSMTSGSGAAGRAQAQQGEQANAQIHANSTTAETQRMKNDEAGRKNDVRPQGTEPGAPGHPTQKIDKDQADTIVANQQAASDRGEPTATSRMGVEEGDQLATDGYTKDDKQRVLAGKPLHGSGPGGKGMPEDMLETRQNNAVSSMSNDELTTMKTNQNKEVEVNNQQIEAGNQQVVNSARSDQNFNMIVGAYADSIKGIFNGWSASGQADAKKDEAAAQAASQLYQSSAQMAQQVFQQMSGNQQSLAQTLTAAQQAQQGLGQAKAS